MKKLTIFILLLILFFPLRENYRILGLFPFPSRSHVVMFQALMKGLAEKGHEVDVLSHFPQEKPPPRYNDISVRGTVPINNFSIKFIQEHLGNAYQSTEHLLTHLTESICTEVLNSSYVRELKNTKKKYDLIIIEIYATDCFFAFAYKFKIPVIGITSSVTVSWGNRIGNPDNPSYIPNYIMPFSGRMNFIERMRNTLAFLTTKRLETATHTISDIIAREQFGPDLPRISVLAYNVSLMLINSHFSINYARPAVSNFIEVGSLHIKPRNLLPKHLEEVLNIGSQYEGVICLSMGSIVRSETFSRDKLQAFFHVFKGMSYQIIWKANKEQMPKDLDIPPNIHFEQWLPQKDVLCHPNVKLFIAHGGLLGLQEAVYCGVPLLGIPQFSDQELNLKMSETLNLGMIIKYEDLTEKRITEALMLLLFDNKYKENVKRLSKILKDQPNPPMDTAIYWIEYVIRHKGSFQLRALGVDLPWYQHHSLDVIITLLVLFTTIIGSTCCTYSAMGKIMSVCRAKRKARQDIIRGC
ncbi:hypothetical protein ILUMI_24093 [Ignelater luminosus]|uniref:UDP-glucuronosyltransferase n=1 Tax=Ignelater luminosus TaxID=2038154 RepID=A0A8K0FWP5_IGNLU|nr:hypothetical protein ILUMI_24093 [Ignelater luminosus]